MTDISMSNDGPTDESDDRDSDPAKAIYEKLAEICAEQGTDRLEVGHWDGGEDSGSEYVDEELLSGKLDSSELDWLGMQLSDALGYGSYAGGFQTNGKFIFDLKGRKVVCEGRWESHEDVTCTIEFERKIPLSEALTSRIVEVVLPERIRLDEEGAVGQIMDEDSRIRPEFCDLILKNGVTPEDYESVVALMRDFVSESINQALTESCGFVEFSPVSLPELTEDGAPRLPLNAEGQVYQSEDEYHELDLNWDENWEEEQQPEVSHE